LRVILILVHHLLLILGLGALREMLQRGVSGTVRLCAVEVEYALNRDLVGVIALNLILRMSRLPL